VKNSDNFIPIFISFQGFLDPPKLPDMKIFHTENGMIFDALGK
jgi:hypothetical protein